MKIGRDLDLFRSVNRAVGGSYIAVQLLSASVAKRTVSDRRTTVQQPLIDAAVSNQCAHELHAD